MDDRGLLLALMQDLLAAPGSEIGWWTFLDHLCDALRGSAASFISHDLASSAAGVAVTARTDPVALQAYHQHWFRFDPWVHSPAAGRLKSGSVVIGDRLIAPNELAKTAYYNDFSKRHGIVQALAGIIEVSDQRLSCLSINRAASRPPFDGRDQALVEALMPGIQRALHVHRRLVETQLMAGSASAALNRLAHGILLVSDSGRILFANETAEAILRTRDGLALEHGELRGSTPAVTDRLRTLLEHAIRSSTELGCTDGVILLPRPSGRRPLSVLVAPLPADRRTGPLLLLAQPQQHGALVFVTDLDHQPPVNADVLRVTFGFTPAEARFAAGLARGATPSELAGELHVTKATGRWLMEQVRSKTGAHTQSQAVAALLRALAPSVGSNRTG